MLICNIDDISTIFGRMALHLIESHLLLSFLLLSFTLLSVLYNIWRLVTVLKWTWICLVVGNWRAMSNARWAINRLINEPKSANGICSYQRQNGFMVCGVWQLETGQTMYTLCVCVCARDYVLQVDDSEEVHDLSFVRIYSSLQSHILWLVRGCYCFYYYYERFICGAC